ncbi:hypothetical protein BDZ90DRAFT_230360 [Jaminaea rosea]|uniref:GTP-binding protein n=1 Tax=Jaminaea rosea TaxID=1569628 RepID=A0A316UW18_9BASI|nr:hypothetical protein BDZ90DRAFT_230360 [Jaminaea rosea]PWN29490.1 hypothetical protein BDZ90DRAFT_230360 [Jaminaea rosea]
MASSRPHPQILLMGMRRSGKTSLLQVLHHHLPPNDTLYLDSTLRPYATTLRPWSPVTIWDGITPQAPLTHAAKDGNVLPDVSLPNGGGPLSWNSISSIIWVLDAQDDYLLSLSQLHSLILVAYANNPRVHVHVFLHKMDGLSEDYRDDTQTDVEKRIEDDLTDASSSFQFARGVSGPRRDSEGAVLDDDDAEGDKVDWTRLERKAVDRATGAASSSDEASATPSSAAAAAASTSRSRDQPTGSFRRRRPSSAKSSTNGHGVSGSGMVALESEVRLSLHQTSIFDSSLFVAFSRVLQDLVLASPGNILRGALNRLIDGFVDSCAPRADDQDDGEGAGIPQHSSPGQGSLAKDLAASTVGIAPTAAQSTNNVLVEKLYLLDLPTRTYLASDSSPFDKTTFQVVCDYLGFLVNLSGLFANLKHQGGAKMAEDVTGNKKRWGSSTLRLASMNAAAAGPSVVGGAGSVAAPGEGGEDVPGSPSLSAVGGVSKAEPAGPAAPTEEELRLCFWQLDQRLALVGVISAQQQQQVGMSSKHRGSVTTMSSRPTSRASEQEGEEEEEKERGGDDGDKTTIPSGSAIEDAAAKTIQTEAAAATASDAEALVEQNVDIFRRAIAALLEATTIPPAAGKVGAEETAAGKKEPKQVVRELWKSSGEEGGGGQTSVAA